jgi:hypothetical protein
MLETFHLADKKVPFPAKPLARGKDRLEVDPNMGCGVPTLRGKLTVRFAQSVNVLSCLTKDLGAPAAVSRHRCGLSPLPPCGHLSRIPRRGLPKTASARQQATSRVGGSPARTQFIPWLIGTEIRVVSSKRSRKTRAMAQHLSEDGRTVPQKQPSSAP